jgi:hypothetical protein
MNMMIKIIPPPILVLTKDFPSKINNVNKIENATPNNCPPNSKEPEESASPIGNVL